MDETPRHERTTDEWLARLSMQATYRNLMLLAILALLIGMAVGVIPLEVKPDDGEGL